MLRACATELAMALNMWKWLTAFAVGCCLLWVWMFRKGSELEAVQPRSTTSDSIHIAALAGAEMNRATDRLRLLQIRDSLTRAVSNGSNGLVVLIDRGYGDSTTQALQTLVRDRWKRAGAPSKVPVVIAAVLDSSSTVSGFPRRKLSSYNLPITTFLPSAETASRCVSVLRIGVPLADGAPKFLKRNLVTPETIDALFGPCIYYASFGKPGPRVERWLRDGDWRFARHADWATTPPQWDPSAQHLASPFVERMTSIDDASWRVRYALRTPGIGCLGGQSGRCVEAVMPGSNTTSEDSTWSANVVASNGTNQFSFYLPSQVSNLGPYDGWLVSEMARSLGVERFEAFWKSSAPVPEAFQAAAGQDLDSWIRDWGRRVYGSIDTGPGVPVSAIFAGMLAFGLAMLIAISIARRRRVA
jgi:hypothetical protein